MGITTMGASTVDTGADGAVGLNTRSQRLQGVDRPSKGELDWNMAQEISRLKDGRELTIVTVGYRGYTLSVYHPEHGDAHITGHLNGTQHRHGYMSDDPQRGDKIKSNSPYSDLFNTIGKPNPLA